MDVSFFRGKRVLLTGHTGFKGSWMSQIMLDWGAELMGYSLEPPTDPSLFSICGLSEKMHSVIGDIRDLDKLKKVFSEARPDIVIHMAAQPLVRDSYKDPVYTYETNVIGTVNLLECVRQSDTVRSVLNVTTDKVYHNSEWEWGYRETDPLDGYDPYSNSKSCSELVTHSYCSSFFAEQGVAVSTARAGNVIGGGDFAIDRIIPDCVRAMQRGEAILVRNPHSTRPYQHVLEPVMAYLLLVQKQYEDPGLAGWYNIGPEDCDCLTTGKLVDLFCRTWGDGARWENRDVGGPHEASFLKLDCSKIKHRLGWSPKWHIDDAIKQTVAWSKSYLNGDQPGQTMSDQIREYCNA